MGQIFVAMLAGVCSREAGQLRLWIDLENLSDKVTEGRSSVRVDEDWVERGGVGHTPPHGGFLSGNFCPLPMSDIHVFSHLLFNNTEAAASMTSLRGPRVFENRRPPEVPETLRTNKCTRSLQFSVNNYLATQVTLLIRCVRHLKQIL